MTNHGFRIYENRITEDYIRPNYYMVTDDTACSDLREFTDDCIGRDKCEELNTVSYPFDNSSFRAWCSNRNDCEIASLKMEVAKRPYNSIITEIAIKCLRVIVKITCNLPAPLAFENPVQKRFQLSAKTSCTNDIQVSFLHLSNTSSIAYTGALSPR